MIFVASTSNAEYGFSSNHQAGSFRELVQRALEEREYREKEWSLTADDDWIHVQNADCVTPAQGWKLHVSAAVSNAQAVLERALPLLLHAPLNFKLASSSKQLYGLNAGHYGRSQVGKFITIYPSSDERAIELARGLDSRLRGLQGPRVLSDRQLTKGGLVHYRYGAFVQLTMQTPVGEIVSALRSEKGELVPDIRSTSYIAPEWVSDPFIAAGVSKLNKPVTLLYGERYFPLAVLSSALRNTVYEALDTRTGERCIMKRAHRSCGFDRTVSTTDRLFHEAAVLDSLGSGLPIPSVRDTFEHEGDLVIVFEQLSGRTLENLVAELAVQGRFLGNHRVADWGACLARLLLELHRRKVVHGDLKPPNILVDAERNLVSLVDFESASELGAARGDEWLSTTGFARPGGGSGRVAAAADDIYALGAVLYYMLTGADPSHAPDPERLLQRRPELLNPGADPALVRVVERCLDGAHSTDSPHLETIHEELTAWTRNRNAWRCQDVA